MLGQRILTAIVLLALLVPSLLLPQQWPFMVLTLLLVAAGGWEWSRLNGVTGWRASLSAVVVAALSWVGLSIGVLEVDALWLIAMLTWIVGGGMLLRAGGDGWLRLSRGLRWAVGVALLTVAWLSIAESRTIGLNFLISSMALVWVADVAAYFGGRAFGRRKLAPTISPGKSWEGVWSGWLGVTALAIAWVLFDRSNPQGDLSVFSRLVLAWGWVGGLGATLVLAALSVMGDLIESLVKRAAGVKDSSQLLPGHGGVLDRVDALLPVIPAAIALTKMAGMAL